MCEVTRSNFEDIFASLETNINRSAFVALDIEFSGLNVDETDKPSLFDTPEDRYRKLRKSVSQFTIPQIGLSAFVPDPRNDSRYVAYSYNVYLFPSSFGPLDTRFLSQASCLEFLCKHNFDFNKFIYEGVPYLNEEQELLLEQYLRRSDHIKALHRMVDENNLQEICSEVASWCVKAKEGDVFTLERSNDMFDVVLITELKQRFQNVWVSEDDGQIIVKKVSLEERTELDSKYFQEDQKRILSRMLGFRRVFNSLVQSRKPIVGHNSFTDLMLLYEKFYKPLPDRYSTYKAEITNIFPRVFDTKYIFYTMKKFTDEKMLPDGSSLGRLFHSLTSEKAVFAVLCSPVVSHGEGCEEYARDSYPHEAGYDAYMCGYVFLKLGHLLAAMDMKPSEVKPVPFHEYLSVLQSYANCLNIIRASVNHVRLNDVDPKSDRPQRIFVKSRKLSGQLVPAELAEQFSQYGSVDVQLLGGRGALVAVSNHRSFRLILRNFRRHPSLVVVRYTPWKHNPYIRGLMWCGVIVFGSLSIWTLYSGFRGNLVNEIAASFS